MRNKTDKVQAIKGVHVATAFSAAAAAGDVQEWSKCVRTLCYTGRDLFYIFRHVIFKFT